MMDKVSISVEVPRKKYHNEDVLKAVMKDEVLYYKKGEEYFSVPLRKGNEKQMKLVFKILKDYLMEKEPSKEELIKGCGKRCFQKDNPDNITCGTEWAGDIHYCPNCIDALQEKQE